VLERATEVLQSRICGRNIVTETMSGILYYKNIWKGIQRGYTLFCDSDNLLSLHRNETYQMRRQTWEIEFDDIRSCLQRDKIM
jgi:hypothetical protein